MRRRPGQRGRSRSGSGRIEGRRRGVLGRLKVLLGTVVVLGLVGLAARVALAGLEGGTRFTVEEVRVEGTRYLDPAELLAIARIEELGTGELETADLERIGGRVAEHPLVARVGVRRSLPAAVVIEVTERVPVAWLATEPIHGLDAEGETLPGLDVARYGSLPFVTGLPEDPEASRTACLRAVALLERVKEEVPGLYDLISEIQPAAAGEVLLVLVGDAVRVRLMEDALSGVLPTVPALLDEGRRRCAPLGEVDLRFAGTVIYRKRRGSG